MKIVQFQSIAGPQNCGPDCYSTHSTPPLMRHCMWV